MSEPIRISNRTARRFVLGKQGIWPGRRQQGKAGTRAAMIACEHVQLDPLVIVARSHDLLLHARVDGYQPRFFDELVYDERQFFDWGGWLAVRPMYELPYWRVLMRRDGADDKLRKTEATFRPVIEEMRRALHERTTLTNREFVSADRKVVDSYRGRKDSSVALYYLWRVGEAMTHHREGFERVYALTETVAPAALIRAAPEAETDRFMLRKHVAFMGIGRPSPIGRILHRKVTRAEEVARVRELVETNEIVPVAVDGWEGAAYVTGADADDLATVAAGGVPGAWTPLSATTEDEVTLLSPLDPVLERRRASAIFDFDYVWEIYKHPDLVQYGRYTMPIVWGDRIVGRVDLRTDRKARTLGVNGIWFERPADARSTRLRAALGNGLRHLAEFVDAEWIDAAALAAGPLRRDLERSR